MDSRIKMFGMDEEDLHLEFHDCLDQKCRKCGNDVPGPRVSFDLTGRKRRLVWCRSHWDDKVARAEEALRNPPEKGWFVTESSG